MGQTLCVPESPFQWSSLPLWACLGFDVALNGGLMSLILSVSSIVVPAFAKQPRPCDDHYQDSAATASNLALMMSKFENRLRQINKNGGSFKYSALEITYILEMLFLCIGQ